MTPRERTVIRAVIKALRKKGACDMRALCSSYAVPLDGSIRETAADLLDKLTEE